MRVMFAVHGTRTRYGIPKYFYLLAKHLSWKNVDVTVAVDSMEGVDIARETCGSNVNIIVRGPYVHNALTTLQYCQNLSQMLWAHDNSFDVFHTAHVNPLMYLATKHHRPVVFQPFGNELFTLSGRGLNPVYCKLAQPLLRFCGDNADILLSEGEFQHAEMKKYYPKAKKVRVLPVGIDTSAVNRKQSYIPKQTFRFLAVNSLHPYEGMDSLIAALRHIHVSYGDIAEVIIVGAGPLEQSLKDMAKDLPVTFYKNIPDDALYNLYATSDAFVCTTRETDFQMGILEAAASGLPIISRKASWLPQSALTYTTDDGLYDAMFRLIGSSISGLRQLGDASLKFVEPFDFTNIARIAIDIYAEALSK
jgi:glycosyltransferase involved in cell wall biosynthesis